MEILYLSHCVPYPPNKGEKIRAFHVLKALTSEHRVHLAAFAWDGADVAAARELESCCASVYVERASAKRSVARAGLKFALGQCLTTSYFESRAMGTYVGQLAHRVELKATVSFTAAMAQYAPADVPLLLDMTDVDSEKWMQYSRMRIGGFIYAIEGGRLRLNELAMARRAQCTFLATEPERQLLHGLVPEAVTATLENGVDFDYFDPARVEALPELSGRKLIAFVGVMDYYPNVDGVCWFASEVMPELRRQEPNLEFFVVGRNPSRRVLRLHGRNGVTVRGSVADVRPYLAAARVVVAPLRLARGIQNKVLEALAMDKSVLASPEICRTFGGQRPRGVVECCSAGDFIQTVRKPETHHGIRAGLAKRFQWHRQTTRIMTELTCMDPQAAQAGA